MAYGDADPNTDPTQDEQDAAAAAQASAQAAADSREAPQTVSAFDNAAGPSSAAGLDFNPGPTPPAATGTPANTHPNQTGTSTASRGGAPAAQNQGPGTGPSGAGQPTSARGGEPGWNDTFGRQHGFVDPNTTRDPAAVAAAQKAYRDFTAEADRNYSIQGFTSPFDYMQSKGGYGAGSGSSKGGAFSGANAQSDWLGNAQALATGGSWHGQGWNPSPDRGGWSRDAAPIGGTHNYGAGPQQTNVGAVQYGPKTPLETISNASQRYSQPGDTNYNQPGVNAITGASQRFSQPGDTNYGAARPGLGSAGAYGMIQGEQQRAEQYAAQRAAAAQVPAGRAPTYGGGPAPAPAGGPVPSLAIDNRDVGAAYNPYQSYPDIGGGAVPSPYVSTAYSGNPYQGGEGTYQQPFNPATAAEPAVPGFGGYPGIRQEVPGELGSAPTQYDLNLARERQTHGQAPAPEPAFAPVPAYNAYPEYDQYGNRVYR